MKKINIEILIPNNYEEMENITKLIPNLIHKEKHKKNFEPGYLYLTAFQYTKNSKYTTQVNYHFKENGEFERFTINSKFYKEEF